MNRHIGSTLESLLEELGEKDEIELLAMKTLVAEALERRMTELALTSSQLATRMKTSRNQVHRLLDPKETGVTFKSLDRASRALGLSFSVKLSPRRRSRAGKVRALASLSRDRRKRRTVE
jgi:plasmid maintenance system antidote protein VapI